jgi:potassium-transporting ATPase potassium-binding subunit
MVKDKRQGYAILATMGALWATILASVWSLEAAHPGTALRLAGASMEGKETRFGVASSALFATSTTATSTGAIDAAHSSFTALGGGLLTFNIGLGEIAPGGTGSGIYGILVVAIVTVFIAGLMVGRTPEYLRKKITAREIKLVSLYILTTPLLALAGTGLAMSLAAPKTSILNPGPHGLTEVLYAFVSSANNNGSAFAGLNANTGFYNTALGLVMLAGRFIPMLFVLALAGSLARQQPVPATAGTLPTHRLLFVAMLYGVVIIVAGLTFFPALALGPLAEGL